MCVPACGSGIRKPQFDCVCKLRLVLVFMCQNVKEGFVLSRAIFNNAIRVFTRHIPSYLIESYIDDSHLSYGSNILLLYNNVDAHQNVVDVFCSKLNEISLSVATSKIRFHVFRPETTSIDTSGVGPATISSSSSLRCFGPSFETSIRSTRKLIVESLKEKLRKSNSFPAREKGQLDKRTLGQLYSPFLHYVCCFLTPLWKIFSTSEQELRAHTALMTWSEEPRAHRV